MSGSGQERCLFRDCDSEQDIPVPVLRQRAKHSCFGVAEANEPVALMPYGNGRRGETAN